MRYTISSSAFSRRLVIVALAIALAGILGIATMALPGTMLSDTALAQTSSTAVSVPANQPWTDTGIDIPVGTQVDITASGRIRIAGSDPGKNPDGTTFDGETPSDSCPLAVANPNAQCWSLIGRIGTGTPFFVGYDTNFIATTSGRLFLGVNDDIFGDNSGAWTADITVSDTSDITRLTFVSDTTWEVFDADPSGSGSANSLGFAQKVCLDASHPSPCPAGATLYCAGPCGGWPADLSSIPGARWIWAPGITRATSPAFPSEFFFSKEFNLPGAPTAGTISVAVDDFAQVLVNGVAVGTTGSVTHEPTAGAAQGSLAAFDITPYLVPGANVITIRAANGPFGCGSGPYGCNAAGVVFGGSLLSGTSADTTPPTVTPPADVTAEATGSDGATVEYDDATASDDKDGVVTATCSPASGTKFEIGTTEVTCSAEDAAGNTGTASFDVTVQDTTAPTISGGVPSDITKTATGSSGAQVSYSSPTANDRVDGSVSVNCTPASGSIFAVGTTTVTCSASDSRNNSASETFKVNVVYDFGNGSGGGFGEPVRDTETNQVKAGQAVPVKFGLGGDYELNIFASGYPTSKKIDCNTGLPIDPIEETVTASTSGLRYDSTTGLYTYVWKTDRNWSGTCRELNLKLADGTNHPVKFQFN